jgi:hypothetical protein
MNTEEPKKTRSDLIIEGVELLTMARKQAKEGNASEAIKNYKDAAMTFFFLKAYSYSIDVEYFHKCACKELYSLENPKIKQPKSIKKTFSNWLKILKALLHF